MLKAKSVFLRTNILLHHIKNIISDLLSNNLNQSEQYIFKYTLYIYHTMGVTWTYFWYISWSPNSQQPLNHLTPTQNIWYCVLTLLIRKTLDFWSIMFLVFLACKHEFLLQKWGDLVLYWIWSSFHIFLSLHPHNSRYKIWNY